MKFEHLLLRLLNFRSTIQSGLGFIAWGLSSLGASACAQITTNEVREYSAAFGQPVIDGKLDDVWQTAAVTSIDRLVSDHSNLPAAKTASADYRCLWDHDQLYFLVEVNDATLNGDNPTPWEQDSVEFFIDENCQRKSSYEADDGQYRVSCKGIVTYGESTSNKITAAFLRTENGYRLEAAIPWQKSKPHSGKKIGFDAQLNDDAGAGRRQAMSKWNQATNDSWNDTSGFGTLQLIGEDGNQPAPDHPAVVPVENEADARVPDWAQDAIFYQIFPERFRNGDPANDPTRASLEFPDIIPETWQVTPWTEQWYARSPWEKQMGSSFYENGVFHRRCGGDLQGVIDKLDYLADLGINTIYFNPVFYARSMHKYDGNSFHHVDPYFGPDPAGDLEMIATETADQQTWQWTAADRLFLTLVQQAHDRKIRVIIDGVFNHAGRDFWAFSDIVKKQQKSAYLEWFTVKAFDDLKTAENEFKYACWWGVDTLPEFADNAAGTDLHPKPKAYIFQSTLRWMDPNGDGDPSDGIDGWRLDVANEVPNQFWRDWNAEIRRLNPAALTVAEFWDEAGNYLADCGFSSTMNYYGFAYPVKGFLIDDNLSASEFGRMLVQRQAKHPRSVQFALQNLIDSHDTDRVASMIVNADHRRPYLNRDKFDFDIGERVSPRHFPDYDVSRPSVKQQETLRLVALFQMTFVGPPMIYYGTEAGMDGADDPDDRMPMVWNDLDYEPRSVGPTGDLAEPQAIKFDQKLHDYYQKLIRLRQENLALRRGEFEIVATDDTAKTILFQRKSADQLLFVGINRGDQPVPLPLPTGLTKLDQLELVFSSGDELTTATDSSHLDSLVIPAMTGQIWRVIKSDVD